MQDNDFKYRIEFTKDEYENLKQYINEFASKLSKMSDEEIQKLVNEFNIEQNLNFEKIIKGNNRPKPKTLPTVSEEEFAKGFK